MITLGIDLSSQPAGTAACTLEWTTKTARAHSPRIACTDDELDVQIAKADAVGLDAPLGWPVDFVRAVAGWQETTWNPELRDRLRFRETDREVRRRLGLLPLSVSTDLIALPAMRAMALLHRHGVTDRSGDGRFFEVYPAASLRVWGWAHRGYKAARDTAALRARTTMLDQIRTALDWLDVPDAYAETADALDSLLAALTTGLAATGRTHRPTPAQLPSARVEGWIHLPTEQPSPLGTKPLRAKRG